MREKAISVDLAKRSSYWKRDLITWIRKSGKLKKVEINLVDILPKCNSLVLDSENNQKT